MKNIIIPSRVDYVEIKEDEIEFHFSFSKAFSTDVDKTYIANVPFHKDGIYTIDVCIDKQRSNFCTGKSYEINSLISDILDLSPKNQI